MTTPFYTIGHSNRSSAEFIGLLQEAGIGKVVDVRTLPGSKANPQFNGEALAASLAQANIDYTHMPALAGLRSRNKAISRDTNAFWHNRSFHNYADHALTEEFQQGLAKLVELGQKTTCAVMCAEAVWWRCHRRIIADYLLQKGFAVYHIMGKGQIKPASQTNSATPTEDGRLTYPAFEQNKD